MAFRIGLLDFGFPVASGPDGMAVGERLTDTICVVERADELGFSRYWLGEHHSDLGSFGGSPEAFLPILAGNSKSMAVGVGAVLIDYYSPLKVANTFLLMEALFPGRIDLGLGRSRADQWEAHLALGGQEENNGLFSDQHHLRQVELLLGLLRNNLPKEDRFHNTVVNPRLSTSCQTWMCGGRRAGLLAARFGTALSLSHFHGGLRVNPVELTEYRRTFVPSAETPLPKISIGVCGAVVRSEAAVEEVGKAWGMASYPPNLIGTPKQWRAFLRDLENGFHMDEVILLDIQTNLEERLWGITALAELVQELSP